MSTGKLFGNADKAEIGEAAQTTLRDELPLSQGVHDLSYGVVCTLRIHDDVFSKENVLMNLSLFAQGSVAAGSRMRVITLEPEFPRSSFEARRDGRHFICQSRSSG